MTARHEGRVALVTGASRGIGLAIAQQLVSEGAKVCVTARHAAALDEVIADVLGPEHAFGVAGAADDPDHGRDAVTQVVERFGGLDVLVNNVGINPAFGDVLDVDDAVARKIFDVNVIAVGGWVRVARPHLATRRGAVVNVASVAGLRPAHGIGMYGASKAALMQLTRQLAIELAPEIRVNAVAPAVVRTRFAARLFEDDESAVAGSYPMARLGDPADVAAVVAHLASPEAAWTTGQIVAIDGGLMLTGGV